MLKKYKKQIINMCFLLAILVITFYVLLKDQELTKIISFIENARKTILLIGVILAIGFVCCESLIIKYLMKKLNHKVSLLHCIKYSFIGFFYSAITPSASGGQPMQVYYMKRDKIDIGESTLVLIIITIVYKIVLLILSVFAIFFEYNMIRENVGGVILLLVYGFLANLLFVIFLLFLIFKQSFAKKAIVSIILWLGKHKIVKKSDKLLKKTLNIISNYDNCAMYIKKNKSIFTFVFFVTLIQRLSILFVTFLVYKSFSLTGTSMYEIISLQTVIALSADSLPLPGGIGVSESSFLVLFDNIFGENRVLAGMLLSRGLTFYVLLILGAVITLLAHFNITLKKSHTS